MTDERLAQRIEINRRLNSWRRMRRIAAALGDDVTEYDREIGVLESMLRERVSTW